MDVSPPLKTAACNFSSYRETQLNTYTTTQHHPTQPHTPLNTILYTTQHHPYTTQNTTQNTTPYTTQHHPKHNTTPPNTNQHHPAPPQQHTLHHPYTNQTCTSSFFLSLSPTLDNLSLFRYPSLSMQYPLSLPYLLTLPPTSSAYLLPPHPNPNSYPTSYLLSLPPTSSPYLLTLPPTSSP